MINETLEGKYIAYTLVLSCGCAATFHYFHREDQIYHQVAEDKECSKHRTEFKESEYHGQPVRCDSYKQKFLKPLWDKCRNEVRKWKEEQKRVRDYRSFIDTLPE